LVLNAGSSSLKFCVYSRPELENWHLESRGRSKVSGSPRISARDAEGGILIDQKLDASVCDAFNALDTLAAWLSFMYRDRQVVGVGHRVVHGGTRYAYPTVVTPEVLAELYRLVPLAPC
jgi:acetate kinase